MARKETRKQYSARHLRLDIERAKIAIMSAQDRLHDVPFGKNSFDEMLGAAFLRLDRAWAAAYKIELAGMKALDREGI